MTKKIHEDQDLRERIRLKCENDWSIKLNESQITMGIMEQEEQKLSIWHNQLWPNKRSYKDKDDGYKWKIRVTWDKTIDGYRAIAHRNGFAGIEPTKFLEHDGKLVMATVTVYRLGADGKRYPYVGEARFEEVAPRNKDGDISLTGQWKTAPYNMLSVAAQRQALRLAFQEFEYVADDIISAPDLDEYEEPELEPTRGESSSGSPAPKSTEEPKPEPEPEPEDPSPAGKYVGIPKDGFQAGKMYNDDERIVLAFEKQGNWVLALDSGVAVRVESSGHETVRRARQDENPGGREWNVGEHYYDGAKIDKIAPAKKDNNVLWLALDSGFKVRVDRWGKETRRKERKSSDGPKNGSEADAPGTSGVGDKGPSLAEVRAMESKEEVRKVCIPLMAKYCIDANKGVKISLKKAYERFTGEVLSQGVNLGLEEYKTLFECLGEALEAHAKGEVYPKGVVQ